MKQQFILFRRVDVFYCENTTTGQQTSLHTRDRDEALRVLHAKNEAERQPAINLQIARAYLAATDGQISTRAWQFVMEEAAKLKKGHTLRRSSTLGTRSRKTGDAPLKWARSEAVRKLLIDSGGK